MIPELEVKSPVAAIEWVTDQATFDYVLPCDSGIPYANLTISAQLIYNLSGKTP
jgi:hypothetical protein